jgi:hypothetical protein
MGERASEGTGYLLWLPGSKDISGALFPSLPLFQAGVTFLPFGSSPL